MTKRFNSYLLRFWDRADGERRIEIEHIQGGTRAVVASTTAALRWLDAHAATAPIGDVLAGASGPPQGGPTDEGETPP